MSQFQYKGKGFVQLTGRRNGKSTMSQISIQPLGAIASSAMLNSSFANLTLNGSSFSDVRQSPSITKFEAYESPEDILTLSCTLQRLRATGEFGLRVLDDVVMRKVSIEDRTKAESIRDYYSKKIMMGNLTDKMYKSSFRRDLAAFIMADGKRFKNNDIGMACYLPDFYDYDTKLDSIKSQVETTLDVSSSSPTVMKLDVVNLTPLSKITKKTKNNKQLEYWFKDDKVNAAVVLSLDPKNQLIKIWDGIFNDSSSLSMSGFFHRTSLDGFEYFRVTNWDLVKA